MTDYLTKLVEDLHGYHSYRTRSLNEEQRDRASEAIAEHIRALQQIESRVAKGDVEGAARGLKEIQNKIGAMAAAMLPVSEEFQGPVKQLMRLSKLAVEYGLYEADELIRKALDEKDTPLGSLPMVRTAHKNPFAK
jgi:hypothetical protein